MNEKSYTVKQLADMAGISVRTLHHYDQIDLLVPKAKTESGHRLYSEQELYRLQQILFFRELGYALKDIADALDDHGFDLVQSLESQRAQLKQQLARTGRLIETIDKTIIKLKSKETMLSHKELYEGFPKGREYREEAMERWGDEVVLTEQRMQQMSKAELLELKAEGGRITEKIAAMMQLKPEDPIVQKAIQEYFEHMNRFYPVSTERYLALGRMYVEDERFAAYYEKVKRGLAVFMRDAIAAFCADRDA